MSGRSAAGGGWVLPPDDVASSEQLNGAYTRHLAGACRRFFSLEGALAPEHRTAYSGAAQMVREVLEQRRGALLACFASPSVAVPLQCLELRDELSGFRERIDEALARVTPHLLLEMALRDLLPAGESILWDGGATALASVACGGELVAPAAATGWRFSSSHIAAIGGSGELGRVEAHPHAIAALGGSVDGLAMTRRYWPVGAVTHLATVDHNPIAAFEEHPDKEGNHIDLGGRGEEEWVRSLEDSFELVRTFLPGEFQDMRRLLHQAVPVGYDDHRHLSASYREAVGTMYLTLHPHTMIMTEAVVHEFQHNKINVAAQRIEFLNNAFHPLYESPIRPDPRPLWGILLAVHAFLPVAELYRRMRDDSHSLAESPEFDHRLSDIDLKNHEGMEMLRAHADWTAAGRELFDELESFEQRHLAERTERGLDNTPDSVHLA